MDENRKKELIEKIIFLFKQENMTHEEAFEFLGDFREKVKDMAYKTKM